MTRKQWLILLGIAMVALTIIPIFVFEKPLEHTGGPGILAFEFAATKARASQILADIRYRRSLVDDFHALH